MKRPRTELPALARDQRAGNQRRASATWSTALRAVAGDAVADLVRWGHDPVIDRIVSTWPARFTADAGRALGMRADADFESIVRAHVSEPPDRLISDAAPL